MSTPTRIEDVDGDVLKVFDNEGSRRLVTINATDSLLDFDRAGAVELIEALTAAVEAADQREAAEARKLKRGDKVRQAMKLPGLGQGLYTVISDETDDGRIALVRVIGPSSYMEAGRILESEPASQYERVPA